MKPTTGRLAAVLATHVLLATLVACHGGTPPPAVQVTSVDTGNGTRHFEATTGGHPDDQITWDFGDGSTATGASVDHAYARAGHYTVLARAPDGGGGYAEEDVSFADRAQGHACVPGAAWCWQAETVMPGTGREAYFVDAQHGWTYSELGAGAIAATTDGGLTWTSQTVPSVHQLAAFRFADALHGVVTSSANELLATDDGGATWRLVTSALPLTRLGGTSRPLSVTAGRIVLDSGQASTDGGQSWTALPLDEVTDVPGDTDCWDVAATQVRRLAGCTGTVATDVTPPGWVAYAWPAVRAFSSPQRLLLLSPGTAVSGWETLDAGATWQAFTAQGLAGQTPTQLLMSTPTTGWLSTLDGGLFATQDAGRTWQPVTLPASFVQRPGTLGIGRLPDGQPWVTDGRTVARTNDGGLTWDLLVLPVPDTAVWNVPTWSADGSVAAVVDGPWGWRRVDGTWERLYGSDPAGVVGDPVAFVARDARHALAVSSIGVQWRTVDGVHWTPSSPFAPASGSPVALEFPASGTAGITGWLVQGGRLWTTVDDGGSWQAAVTPGPLTSLLDVHFVDVTHGWLLDRLTGLYRTTDAGAHWTAAGSPAPGPWMAMAFTSDRRGMLVAADGASWLTGDGGATWQASDQRADVRRLKITADGSIWSFGYWFQRSRDGGVTFTTLAGQDSPPQDITFTDSLNGWLIDQDGAVSVTTDGGSTWTRTALGDWTVQLEAIAMADPQTGWILTRTGDLLFTATGGR